MLTLIFPFQFVWTDAAPILNANRRRNAAPTDVECPVKGKSFFNINWSFASLSWRDSNPHILLSTWKAYTFYLQSGYINRYFSNRKVKKVEERRKEKRGRLSWWFLTKCLPPLQSPFKADKTDDHNSTYESPLEGLTGTPSTTQTYGHRTIYQITIWIESHTAMPTLSLNDSYGPRQIWIPVHWPKPH